MLNYAIIPARGGSKGIPKKNIKLLCGHPLIAYSIAIAKLANSITRVITSTDSEEIADISKYYGSEVPFFRPTDIAQDNSTDTEFILHAINWLDCYEKNLPDFFIHLRPTTPLRDPLIVNTAILNFNTQYSNYTSMRSAHRCSESPFKWFIKKDSCFTGMSAGVMDDFNAPRQAFNDVYIPDGYLDILKVSYIREAENIHGSSVFAFESPICNEVDIIEDFEFIEYKLKKSGSILLEYLNNYVKF